MPEINLKKLRLLRAPPPGGLKEQQDNMIKNVMYIYYYYDFIEIFGLKMSNKNKWEWEINGNKLS